jgi:hypothetical protein
MLFAIILAGYAISNVFDVLNNPADRVRIIALTIYASSRVRKHFW